MTRLLRLTDQCHRISIVDVRDERFGTNAVLSWTPQRHRAGLDGLVLK